MLHAVILLCLRIIPTRVGTSVSNVHCFQTFEDHPHACGDKLFHCLVSNPLMESSPRVWGQATYGEGYNQVERIIPTRVGTRLRNNIRYGHRHDHPHACGDKTLVRPSISRRLLSSPRVWGQVTIWSDKMDKPIIIPTRVGTRPQLHCKRGLHQDHPHAYGDKLVAVRRRWYPIGSSPRVWGQG